MIHMNLGPFLSAKAPPNSAPNIYPYPKYPRIAPQLTGSKLNSLIISAWAYESAPLSI